MVLDKDLIGVNGGDLFICTVIFDPALNDYILTDLVTIKNRIGNLTIRGNVNFHDFNNLQNDSNKSNFDGGFLQYCGKTKRVHIDLSALHSSVYFLERQ